MFDLTYMAKTVVASAAKQPPAMVSQATQTPSWRAQRSHLDCFVAALLAMTEPRNDGTA
jgi:hypothetical protein